MKMRVALFVWARFPDLIPPQPRREDKENDRDYSRVSEWVEVEFPDITEASKRAIQLESLRKQREMMQRDHKAEDEKRSKALGSYLDDLDKKIAALEKAPETSEPQAGEERAPA